MSDDELEHEVGVEDGSEGGGSDEESTASSQMGGKKVTAKGKKESGAKAAAKGKGEKKASPAKKRKESGEGGAAAAASSAPKKAKAAAASSDDPKEVVRQYMVQQNRSTFNTKHRELEEPYTALVVYENLHHQIKKPALIKYLDELTEEGHLQVKDFKKVRVYLAKQDAASAPDPSELDALNAEEAQLRESLNDVKSANSKLSEQIRLLQNEPSDADLASQLSEYRKRVDALNARLARIKGDGKQVSKASMDKMQVAFNEAARAWSKRKRAATDMIDAMCGEDGDPKEAIARFGIETDEDAEVKFTDWKDYIKDIKK